MDGLNPQRRSDEAAVPLNVAMSLSRATSGLPRSGFVQTDFCAIRCRSALFVFTNKRSSRIEVSWFDRNGYCLLYKRLHKARFDLPDARVIDGAELGRVLRGRVIPISDANRS